MYACIIPGRKCSTSFFPDNIKIQNIYSCIVDLMGYFAINSLSVKQVIDLSFFSVILRAGYNSEVKRLINSGRWISPHASAGSLSIRRDSILLYQEDCPA
jgi:hypothetical protein